jgi:hypothetical protein
MFWTITFPRHKVWTLKVFSKIDGNRSITPRTLTCLPIQLEAVGFAPHHLPCTAQVATHEHNLMESPFRFRLQLIRNENYHLHDLKWTNPFGVKLAVSFSMLQIKVLHIQEDQCSRCFLLRKRWAFNPCSTSRFFYKKSDGIRSQTTTLADKKDASSLIIAYFKRAGHNLLQITHTCDIQQGAMYLERWCSNKIAFQSSLKASS